LHSYLVISFYGAKLGKKTGTEKHFIIFSMKKHKKASKTKRFFAISKKKRNFATHKTNSL